MPSVAEEVLGEEAGECSLKKKDLKPPSQGIKHVIFHGQKPGGFMATLDLRGCGSYSSPAGFELGRGSQKRINCQWKSLTMRVFVCFCCF